MPRGITSICCKGQDCRGDGGSVASIAQAGPLDKAATVEEPEIPHLLALTAARLRGKGALSAQHQRSTRDGGSGVAKPEWGAKPICHNCGERYYDKHRAPLKNRNSDGEGTRRGEREELV